jgi:hypothetical protein
MRQIILAILLTMGTAAGAANYDVRDMGAVGDGTTDDTAAFQQALNRAAGDGGGTVHVPEGNYRIDGNLTIGPNVALEGVWLAPTAWTENKGSTLLALAGAGDENGTPFITMTGSNPVLKGITIYYPEQTKEGREQPVPYPWTVKHGAGDNMTIIDCLFVNPYQAVDLTLAGRHFIRNLYGSPLYRGIYVDQIYDVGRIENVHFWPFAGGWAADDPYWDWVNKYAIAFEFGRTDWQYCFNTFCFGYGVGYRFFRSDNGVCNGNFLGIGADWCGRAVKIDDCWDIGVLITNGEFVAAEGVDATSVYVGRDARGAVTFQNCSFWGPAYRIATILGSSTVMFQGCNFLQWDKLGNGQPAIHASDGRLTVSGCNFKQNGKEIYIGDQVDSAIIMGNHVTGTFDIENLIGQRAQIGLNAGIGGVNKSLLQVE